MALAGILVVGRRPIPRHAGTDRPCPLSIAIYSRFLVSGFTLLGALFGTHCPNQHGWRLNLIFPLRGTAGCEPVTARRLDVFLQGARPLPLSSHIMALCPAPLVYILKFLPDHGNNRAYCEIPMPRQLHLNLRQPALSIASLSYISLS